MWNAHAWARYIFSGSESTKGSFRGKKTQKFSILKAIFLKQKRRSATKNVEVSLIN